MKQALVLHPSNARLPLLIRVCARLGYLPWVTDRVGVCYHDVDDAHEGCSRSGDCTPVVEFEALKLESQSCQCHPLESWTKIC